MAPGTERVRGAYRVVQTLYKSIILPNGMNQWSVCEVYDIHSSFYIPC